MVDRTINVAIVLAVGTFATTKLLIIDRDYWHIERFELKPTISLPLDKSGASKALFANLCKNGLGLGESVMRQEMAFFKEIKHIMLTNMSAIGSGSLFLCMKPTISLPLDESGAIEARFADLCKNGLGLDESMMRQTMAFFKESKHIMLANTSMIGSELSMLARRQQYILEVMHRISSQSVSLTRYSRISRRSSAVMQAIKSLTSFWLYWCKAVKLQWKDQRALHLGAVRELLHLYYWLLSVPRQRRYTSWIH